MKIIKTFSKFKGVFKDHNSIKAVIKMNSKSIHLGMFNSEIEAAKAYDLAALHYFQEFANLNFPVSKS